MLKQLKWISFLIALALSCQAMDEKELGKGPGKEVTWFKYNSKNKPEVTNKDNNPTVLRLDITGYNNDKIVSELKNFTHNSLRSINIVTYFQSGLNNIWEALEKINTENVTELAITGMTLNEKIPLSKGVDVSFKASRYNKLFEILPNVNSSTLAFQEGNHDEALKFMTSFKKPLKFFWVSIGKDQKKPDLIYGINPHTKAISLPPITLNNAEIAISLLNKVRTDNIDWVELAFAKNTEEVSTDTITWKISDEVGQKWRNIKGLTVFVKDQAFSPTLMKLFGSIFTTKSVELYGGKITTDTLSKSVWESGFSNLEHFSTSFNEGANETGEIIEVMINIFKAQPKLKVLEVNEDWLHTEVIIHPKWTELLDAAKSGGKNIQLLRLPTFTTWDQVGSLAEAFPNLKYIAANSIQGFIDPSANAKDVTDLFGKFKKLQHVYVHYKEERPDVPFAEVYIKDNKMDLIEVNDKQRLVALQKELADYFKNTKINYSSKKVYNTARQTIIKTILGY